jgi:hypothetical protein
VISDQRLAELAEAAYCDTPRWSKGDAFVCSSTVDGFQVVAFRGTEPEHLTDLLHDADALPAEHPQLGLCHAGFLANVLGVAPAIMGETAEARLILTGHSKGAAEAALLCGLLVAAGRPPVSMTSFGMPRPAFLTLQKLVGRISGTDYRHGNDPVTEVPIGFHHPRPLVQLGEKRLTFDPLADHAIAAYRAALAASLPSSIR